MGPVANMYLFRGVPSGKTVLLILATNLQAYMQSTDIQILVLNDSWKIPIGKYSREPSELQLKVQNIERGPPYLHRTLFLVVFCMTNAALLQIRTYQVVAGRVQNIQYIHIAWQFY